MIDYMSTLDDVCTTIRGERINSKARTPYMKSNFVGHIESEEKQTNIECKYLT